MIPQPPPPHEWPAQLPLNALGYQTMTYEEVMAKAKAKPFLVKPPPLGVDNAANLAKPFLAKAHAQLTMQQTGAIAFRMDTAVAATPAPPAAAKGKASQSGNGKGKGKGGQEQCPSAKANVEAEAKPKICHCCGWTKYVKELYYAHHAELQRRKHE